MALRSDAQGFLIGEVIENLGEIDTRLVAIARDVAAIRRLLMGRVDINNPSISNPSANPATRIPPSPAANDDAAPSSDTAAPRPSLSDSTREPAPRPLPIRDSRGRFGSGENNSTEADRLRFMGGISDAIAEGLSDSERLDPTIQAFSEVVTPLSRTFSLFTGGDDNRKRDRWYKKFFHLFTQQGRNEARANRETNDRLRNLGEQNQGSWLSKLIMLIPLFGALLGGIAKLPTLLASVLKGLIPEWLGKLLPDFGGDTGNGGRNGNRRGWARRLGGVKGLGALGALLGLGSIASTEMDETLTREQKNLEHGRVIGGAAPAALGAVAGGAIGTMIFPGIGTAIGAVIGGYAADYFAGDAGEDIGVKIAEWVNAVDLTQLPSQILNTVSGWVDDLKKSEIGQSIKSTWDSFITESKSFLGGTLKTLEEKGNQFNDWFKDKTGIDLKDTASKAVEGANAAAKSASDFTVKTLDQANTTVKDLTGFDAKASLETANKALGEAATRLADNTKTLAKSIYEWASGGSSTPEPTIENKHKASGASWLNMMTWGVRNYETIKSSVSNYMQSNPVAQTLMGEKQSTVSGLIHWGESKQRGYNDYNRGSDKHAASNRQNLDLQNMTIGQIMQQQALPIGHKDRLFAVGKYQAIPDTLKAATKELGIGQDALFTPEIQEKIFTEYLATAKKGRGALEGYIKGSSDNLTEANLDVAKEWASVAHKGNSGYYDGVGNNKAHISAGEMRGSLTNARATYQRLIGQGMDEKQAYGVALGAYQENGQLAPQPKPPLMQRVAKKAELSSYATGETLPSIVQQMRVKDSQGNTRTLAEMGISSFDELQSKGGQAFKGGYNDPATLYATALVQQGLGGNFNRLTAQNDEYHQKHAPNSAHTKGNKTDFTVSGMSYADAHKRTAQILGEQGLVEGKDFSIISKRHGTGDHIDFKLGESGQVKISQLMQSEQAKINPVSISPANALTLPSMPSANPIKVNTAPEVVSGSTAKPSQPSAPAPMQGLVGQDVRDRQIAHIVTGGLSTGHY